MDILELDWDTGAPTGTKSVDLLGPEIGFRARSNSSASSLAITKLFNSPKEFEWGVPNYLFFKAPYSFESATMEQALFGNYEDCRIVDVRPYEESGKRLVEISCRFDEKRKHPTRATITFLRDLNWAVSETKQGPVRNLEPNDVVRECKCEYEGANEGIPLLKRVTYFGLKGPEREQKRVAEYEVTRFVPGPVPESEFLPSAINLRVGKPQADQWPRILVLVVGALLIALYVYLKRRAPAY
jgi:hypothetical protein